MLDEENGMPYYGVFMYQLLYLFWLLGRFPNVHKYINNLYIENKNDLIISFDAFLNKKNLLYNYLSII